MISPETLRRFPYFSGLSDDGLKSVAMISEEVSFKAGEHLFDESGTFKAGSRIYSQEGTASHLMLLTEGDVEVGFDLADGKQVVVGTLVPGDLMALSALIPPHRLTASGIAKTDGKMIAIEAEPLRACCEDNPALGYSLMKHVSKAIMQRLMETRLQLAGTS